MKSVKVEVTTPDGRDTTAAGVYLEENRGSGGWHRVDGKDAVTNKGPVTLTVRPNQRIIIDAYPTPEMVYDRDQGAAVNPNTQQTDEPRADRAEASKGPSEVEKQEKARLDKAAKDAGGQTPPPVGQAVPPTSREAAIPTSGPSGTPLRGGTIGQQTGSTPKPPPPRTTPTPPPNNPAFRTAAENERVGQAEKLKDAGITPVKK